MSKSSEMAESESHFGSPLGAPEAEGVGECVPLQAIPAVGGHDAVVAERSPGSHQRSEIGPQR